ncbi:MAG: hypothetical protein E6767_07435 [Dysgonomonas sp.]|nr:hypothetical protein [Dysgonomonas sp.]
MKLINLFSVFLLTSLFICFTACSDDDKVSDLTLEKELYIVPVAGSTNIKILGGYDNLELTKGADLFEFSYIGNSGKNTIGITGMKVGTTSLTVRNPKLNQEVTVTIKVVPAYTSFLVDANIGIDIEPISVDNKELIRKEINDNISIKSSYVISLIKDEEKTLYIFESKDKLAKAEFLYKGTYEFEKKEDAGYLILNYKNAGAEETHRYKLDGNTAIAFINLFFDLDWTKAKMSEPALIAMDLTEDYTEVLKSKYPQLESAISKMKTILFYYPNLELPVELFE